MPWSFDYAGQPVTHENDECYIVATHKGSQILTPKHMLITDDKGSLYICEEDAFEMMCRRHQCA